MRDIIYIYSSIFAYVAQKKQQSFDCCLLLEWSGLGLRLSWRMVLVDGFG